MPILTYAEIEAPSLGTGELAQIVPGVDWLRMPVPGSLKAINLWLLSGSDRLTLVDSGLRTDDTRQAWGKVFEGVAGQTVERVLLTHMHPDHSGLAGWLVEQHPGARLCMSRLEYYVLRDLARNTGGVVPGFAIEFYRRCGWSEEELQAYQRQFGSFGEMVHPLPGSFEVIADGDCIEAGLTKWEVVTGRGHSPEQCLLYSRDEDLLIAGDQVLPKISPNVSVFPQEPYADPLTIWLGSLAEIKQRVPDSVLVLPSHGAPFRGLHARIDAVVEGHEKSLRSLEDFLEAPRRAVDTFEVLFGRQIGPSQMGMATGEALAHLACLKTRGLARKHIGSDGYEWWSRA